MDSAKDTQGSCRGTVPVPKGMLNRIPGVTYALALLPLLAWSFSTAPMIDQQNVAPLPSDAVERRTVDVGVVFASNPSEFRFFLTDLDVSQASDIQQHSVSCECLHVFFSDYTDRDKTTRCLMHVSFQEVDIDPSQVQDLELGISIETVRGHEIEYAVRVTLVNDLDPPDNSPRLVPVVDHLMSR